MWRPETDSSNLFQLFSTKHGVFYSSSLAVQQAFQFPITEITDMPCCVSIYKGAEDPDSGPHAWTVSILLTEPSL